MCYHDDSCFFVHIKQRSFTAKPFDKTYSYRIHVWNISLQIHAKLGCDLPISHELWLWFTLKLPTVFRDNQVLKQRSNLNPDLKRAQSQGIVVQGGPIGNPVINGGI